MMVTPGESSCGIGKRIDSYTVNLVCDEANRIDIVSSKPSGEYLHREAAGLHSMRDQHTG